MRIRNLFKWGKWGYMAGGVLLSTLGYQMVRSRDAKKLYTFLTAAVLREKDAIMREVTSIAEDCADIYADAKAENERRAEAVILDAADGDFKEV